MRSGRPQWQTIACSDDILGTFYDRFVGTFDISANHFEIEELSKAVMKAYRIHHTVLALENRLHMRYKPVRTVS
jgi:hypothetical protein